MSRTLSRAATKTRDIDVAINGNPNDIFNRIKRKKINKTTHNLARKISKKLDRL